MTALKWFFVVLLFATLSIAQTSQKSGQNLYVQSPRTIALPVVAVQPNCPLGFEEVGFFEGLDGGGFVSYRLRNIGTKPIRAFAVGTSSGAEYSLPRELGRIVMPGELVTEPDGERNNIIPITNDIRKRLKFDGPMRTIVILMVVNAEFTDGTSFNDEAVYRGMTTFTNKLDDALHFQEEVDKKRMGKLK
jgi:hypothetical protein